VRHRGGKVFRVGRIHGNKERIGKKGEVKRKVKNTQLAGEYLSKRSGWRETGLDECPKAGGPALFGPYLGMGKSGWVPVKGSEKVATGRFGMAVGLGKGVTRDGAKNG